jgi:hypothetical protein
MAKQKVTITLDRAKSDDARSLAGAKSTSEVIDLALDHFIRFERLRRDVAAYRRVPPTESENALATMAAADGLDDATDWEALYAADSA